jgi:hypothetical protein
MPGKKVEQSRGLLIKSPWIDEIISGRKIWEIRGSNTSRRGRIALIRSGSGCIVGTCDLIDVVGPLTIQDFVDSTEKHRVNDFVLKGRLPYHRTFAWVIANVSALVTPVRYKHPPGAIIWVKLPLIYHP